MAQDLTPFFRNLMAVGLLGTVYRAAEDAEAVNEVIEQTLDNPLQYRLCRAVVCGMAGTPEPAIGDLSRYVEAHPQDEPARLALAISLILAGKPEGRAAVERLIATTDDTSVRSTAHEMLELIRQEPALLN